jgi:hypothetical protein
MKTTVHIEKNLLNHASRLTGIVERAALIRMALEALILQESARHGGADALVPQAALVPRKAYQPRAKAVALPIPIN